MACTAANVSRRLPTCRIDTASHARIAMRDRLIVRAFLEVVERDLDDELGPYVDRVRVARDLQLQKPLVCQASMSSVSP